MKAEYCFLLNGAERRAVVEGCRNAPRINVPTIVLFVSVCLASGASGLADSNRPTALLAVSPNLPASQKLTPEEAEQALRRLRDTMPGPGTWRSTTLEFAPDAPDTNVIPALLLASSDVTYGWPTSTNVTHVWRLADGRRFMRNE